MNNKLNAMWSNLTPRQRQIVLAGGVLVVIVLIAVIGVSLTSGKKDDSITAALATSSQKPEPVDIARPGSHVDPKAVWMGKSQEEIKTLNEATIELKKRIEQLEAENKAHKEQALKEQADQKKTRDLQKIADEARRAVEASANNAATLPAAPPVPNGAVAPPRKVGFPPGTPGVPGDAIAQAPMPAIFTLSVAGTDATSGVSAVASAAAAETTRSKDKDSYIPTGSFAKGVLLSGLDAPTGGQAQQNPHPVLVKLVDHAILPNEFRFKVRDCFVLGSGYGDLSSERAYIRSEALSCVLRDGSVVDQPLKGFVAGHDGKAGVRGRLVSKQGQVLASALLSGVASGIGSAISQSNLTTQISPLGTVQSLDTDKVFETGAATGVSKALDKLANYYIRLAEQMFPVIEVDSGSKVDIIVTQGMHFGDSADVGARGANQPGGRTAGVPPTDARLVGTDQKMTLGRMLNATQK